MPNDTYVVQKGDTLSEIAVKAGMGYYGYKTLAAINDISNPDLIYVGQKLKLKADAPSSTTTTQKVSVLRATITHFGLQSNSDNTLFAMWKWDKSDTDKYQVKWEYYAGSTWFVGSSTAISVDEHDPSASKQSTYNIPKNATSVRFKVKPIAKGTTKNNKTTYPWTAEWSQEKKYYVQATPPDKPNAPTVTIKNNSLTAVLEGIDDDTITEAHFKLVKNDTVTDNQKWIAVKYPVAGAAGRASCQFGVALGNTYKVCCRVRSKTNPWSDWSEYSPSVGTSPPAPDEITQLKALSATSVYIEWTEVSNATGYTIEYTTDRTYFDSSSSNVHSASVESVVHHAEITGLETGTEHFFRVKAVNAELNVESAWTEIKSVIIGKTPTAPTTWSSTTTVIVGEPLNLYWIHNSEDNSSQTYAEIWISVNGNSNTYTIKGPTDENKENPTNVYTVDTSGYTEGARIIWSVRTAGITKTYGEWSVDRTVDVYAQPTVELRVQNSKGESIDVVESFPFTIRALAGPNTQAPIGYHLTISANESYETTDNMGEMKIVNENEAVYSQHFDVSTNPLVVEISANNVNLDNNISYTVTCVASMNSGLNAEQTARFTVSWEDLEYEPNAEIGVDTDTLVAQIRPYCEAGTITRYRVLRGANYTPIVDLGERGDVYIFGEQDAGRKFILREPIELTMTCFCTFPSETIGVNFAIPRKTLEDMYSGAPLTTVTFKFINFEPGPYDETRYAYTTVVANYEINGIRQQMVWDFPDLIQCDKSDLDIVYDEVTTYARDMLYRIDNIGEDRYVTLPERVGGVYGTTFNGIFTTTGERVYNGTTAEGEDVYYCEVETASLINGVTLSVYRREFDGKFTEIATDLDNTKGTFVTDPHPALDYARYRIVAKSNATGAVSYQDIPGYLIGETSAIIQWDEEWKTFDVSNEDALSDPAWTGQVLKLPYNIDVSNDHKSDVELVEYIGREHPVSYYGTQLGETAVWNVVIRKDDTDTLFTLRRLAIWQGDVYVREPSGSGYWANVTVGYGQKHKDLTIPITLNITRVEGGM